MFSLHMNPKPTNNDSDNNEDGRPPAWHQTVVFDPDAPEWQHTRSDLTLVWNETTPIEGDSDEPDFGVCIFNPDPEKMETQWLDSDHHLELNTTR